MRHAGIVRPRPRARLSAAALVGAALALSACGAEGGTGAAAPSAAGSAAPSSAPSLSPSGASATGAPGADVEAVSADGIAWGHVHNLAYDGDALVLGTHHGLYRQPAGQAPALVSATEFDVMGLAYDGTRWLASGHPAQGEDLPPDLGLRASPDGRAWSSVSLLGEVDFHRLTASGSTVMGVSAHDGALLRSTDAGVSWTRLDNPDVFDLALSPVDATLVMATTESGPLRSTDGGSSWQRIEDAPLLAFVAFGADAVHGVAPDGAVHVSTDDGATWSQAGSVEGRPAAFAAGDGRIAVLVGNRVVESVDGGATFAPRITGIGGH